MTKKQGWLGVVALAAVLMAGPAAQAYIGVDWTTTSPIMQFGHGSFGDYPGFIVPVGSLCQLIWSPDAVANDIQWTGSISPTGGDVLLATAGTDSDGFLGGGGVGVGQYDAASYPAIPDNATLVSGMIYVRIWDSPTPAVGNYYIEGSLANGGMDASLTDSPFSPQTYDTPRLGDGENVFAVTTMLQAIPEPGTLALFGVGAAVIALRRRTRR